MRHYPCESADACGEHRLDHVEHEHESRKATNAGNVESETSAERSNKR